MEQKDLKKIARLMDLSYEYGINNAYEDSYNEMKKRELDKIKKKVRGGEYD